MTSSASRIATAEADGVRQLRAELRGPHALAGAEPRWARLLHRSRRGRAGRGFRDAGLLRTWLAGINVEPTPGAFARLDAARPRDINLQRRRGRRRTGEAGTSCLVDGGNGLSTLSERCGTCFASDGREIQTVRVAVRRLADLCREHVQGDIHFLKIDVEGGELAAPGGAELAMWRPWIIAGGSDGGELDHPDAPGMGGRAAGTPLRHGVRGWAEPLLRGGGACGACQPPLPCRRTSSTATSATKITASPGAALRGQVEALAAEHATGRRSGADAAEQQVDPGETQLDHAAQELWESNRLAEHRGKRPADAVLDRAQRANPVGRGRCGRRVARGVCQHVVAAERRRCAGLVRARRRLGRTG